MSAWTVSFVTDLDPAALSSDAESLRLERRVLADRVEDIVVTRRRMLDDWEGRTAEAARERIGRHMILGDDIMSVIDAAATALDAGAATLANARDTALSAVEVAQADRCAVADDGTCTPPPVTLQFALPANASAAAVENAEQQIRLAKIQAQALATQHTQAIQTALSGVKDADRQVADTLRGIEVPNEVAHDARQVMTAIAGLPSDGYTGALPLQFGPDWSLVKNFRTMTAAEWEAAVAKPGAGFMALALTDGLDPGHHMFTGYTGAGAVEGPDGKLYPLVVPNVMTAGGLIGFGATANPHEHRPENLDGLDEGWYLVGRDEGVAKTNPTSSEEMAAIGVGGALGAKRAGGPEPEYDLREDIATTADGFPYLDGRHESSSGPGTPFGDPRDNPTAEKPATPGWTPGGGKTGTVFDVVNRVGDTAATINEVKANEDTHYILDLEQNEDGRRRALLRTVDVFKPWAETIERGVDHTIYPHYGYFPESGHGLAEVDYNVRGADQANPNPTTNYKEAR